MNWVGKGKQGVLEGVQVVKKEEQWQPYIDCGAYHLLYNLVHVSVRTEISHCQ